MSPWVSKTGPTWSRSCAGARLTVIDGLTEALTLHELDPYEPLSSTDLVRQRGADRKP